MRRVNNLRSKLFLRLVAVSRGRLRHRLKYDADRIGHESRRQSDAIVRDGRCVRRGQFFCTRQLPPAALRFEHNSVASSAEANGPTVVR